MIFIFGGKHQGKTTYALTQYGPKLNICDLATEKNLDNMYEADVIKNIQDGVSSWLQQEITPINYFAANIDRLKHKILLGTEIGCGIVPLEQTERIWRDETGRVYQILVSHAKVVERVWAGIAIRLKG